jgi:hypothetical protein
MAAWCVATLMKASSLQSSSTHSCCSRENPRSGYPISGDDEALGVAPSWGHHFWSRWWRQGGWYWVLAVWCSRGSVMDVPRWNRARREHCLASWWCQWLILVYQLGDWLAGSGGGDFWRMRTRHYLWIVLGSRRSWWSRHNAMFSFLQYCTSLVPIWWLRFVRSVLGFCQL